MKQGISSVESVMSKTKIKALRKFLKLHKNSPHPIEFKLIETGIGVAIEVFCGSDTLNLTDYNVW